jgi:gentisate 1,2-dioxygenase
MSASMQMLRPAEHTKAHRHTGNVIYNVAKGSGTSIINGKEFHWKEKDIFCVPSWHWHEHKNSSSSDDACLFSFNDFPVMDKLGFYLEEPYQQNNGHQQVI